MSSELGAVVESRRATHRWIKALQNVGDRRHRFCGAFAGKPGHYGQARLAFVQHQERPVVLAYDQIGFPVTALGARVSSLRALRNMGLVLDLIP